MTKTYDDLLALAESQPPFSIDGKRVDEAESETTQESSKGIITNYTMEYDESIVPLPMNRVADDIFETAANWPRQCGSTLFAHDSRGLHWLESSASLFGWLRGRVTLCEWSRAPSCVTKDEVFHELRRSAVAYEAIDELPHVPAIENHYYTCPSPAIGNGETLKKLLDFFSPETPIDRQLLTTAFATPLWGGPPGCRPAFLFTSKGRGKGKTKQAETIARVFGGSIDINPHEDISVVMQRLLSPEALMKRIAFLDNVKSARFSWAFLESKITADMLSGKRLYVGESRRSNYLTWLITLNGASLSTDMAQRVIEIKIEEPHYAADWEERLTAFVQSNRQSIIDDLAGFLNRPTKKMKRYSRWGTWDDQILSRVDSPDKCLDMILDRRSSIDVEEEEGELVEQFFASKLKWLKYDVERDDVFLPNEIVAKWYNMALGTKSKVSGVSRGLRQFVSEGRITRIVPTRCGGGNRDRGFRWVGGKADISSFTHHDLFSRLKNAREENKLGNREDGETSESW